MDNELAYQAFYDVRYRKSVLLCDFQSMQIEQLITEFAPTMLLVEHDNVFRDTVASNIVNI